MQTPHKYKAEWLEHEGGAEVDTPGSMLVPFPILGSRLFFWQFPMQRLGVCSAAQLTPGRPYPPHLYPFCTRVEAWTEHQNVVPQRKAGIQFHSLV